MLDERHPLSHVLPGGHALWAKADVVLAVGTRLQLPLDAWGIDDKLKIIKIDIDPEEMERPAQAARSASSGNAAAVLRRLDRASRASAAAAGRASPQAAR